MQKKNKRDASRTTSPLLSLNNYLQEKSIIFLQETTRDAALKAMVKHLAKLHVIQDVERFYRAILDRENIVSTGIGMGWAIPHAKMPEFEHFFMVLGIQSDGIEWNSLDGFPVRLAIMIGGPDDRQTEYLKALSDVTTMAKNEELRRKLLLAKNAAAASRLLRDL